MVYRAHAGVDIAEFFARLTSRVIANGASVGQLDRIAELLGLSYAKGTLNPSWELSQIEQVFLIFRPLFPPRRNVCSSDCW